MLEMLFKLMALCLQCNGAQGKPDTAIYNLFLQRLRALDKHQHVLPSDLVFVDDKAKNIEAARVLGWQALLYNANTANPGTLEAGLAALGVRVN